MSKFKTFSATPADIQKGWCVVDAEGLVLGRLASLIATRLRGKHKPSYTPNMDCGDNVIVVNAEKVLLKGNKRTQKTYYWHTGYPGELNPAPLINCWMAVFLSVLLPKRLNAIPRGPLGRRCMKHLHVYAGDQHPHNAQQPQKLDVAAMNPKNTAR